MYFATSEPPSSGGFFSQTGFSNGLIGQWRVNRQRKHERTIECAYHLTLYSSDTTFPSGCRFSEHVCSRASWKRDTHDDDVPRQGNAPSFAMGLQGSASAAPQNSPPLSLTFSPFSTLVIVHFGSVYNKVIEHAARLHPFPDPAIADLGPTEARDVEREAWGMHVT